MQGSPAALFSIGAIAFVLFAYKRYLGKTGALIAGVLFLISPFMLFYGRYTRNEAFIQLFGVVMIYAILRYLDKGDKNIALFTDIIYSIAFLRLKKHHLSIQHKFYYSPVLCFLDNVVKIKWKK